MAALLSQASCPGVSAASWAGLKAATSVAVSPCTWLVPRAAICPGLK